MIGVLVSGEGTNLQALLDAGLPVRAVATNRPGCRALERAEAAGVATGEFPLEQYASREERDGAMAGWLERRGVELVVCAGYMHLLTSGFLARFPERIVNVHPSLLPAFPGIRSIEAALEHGVKLTGVTVHFVDEGVDSGPIVLQESFELPYHRDIAAIEQRFHEVEHRLLPRAVRLIAAGRVQVDEQNPRLVHVEPDSTADG
jgi:phosphoribosylglycinamide formyltransferase-1